MSTEKRKQYLSVALLLAAAALVIDRLGSFYADERSQMVNQRNATVRALADAQNLLKREMYLRHFLAGADAYMRSDSSAIEGRLMHRLHDWEEQSGVREASFQRVALADEHGFVRLTFAVSAIGNQWAVAGLLYRVETAPIPLRLENAQVQPMAGGDDVQIHLNFSTLCQAAGTPLDSRLASYAEGPR